MTCCKAKWLWGLSLLAPVVIATELNDTTSRDMVLIKGGNYTPLYKEDGQKKNVIVAPFYLDKYQVTNQQFWQFTQQQPRWSKNNIVSIFAESGYLAHIKADVIPTENANQPVVNVSWFAAMAYCKHQGKRLPSTDEWEYVARASQNKANGIASIAYREQILQWYSKPATDSLPNVKQTQKNYWGVYGMHGVVWELVRDFNSSLVTGESRGDSALDNKLFCGSGATQSVDPSDYAAFMRYAMRSSYAATYTMKSVGFRCAQDIHIK